MPHNKAKINTAIDVLLKFQVSNSKTKVMPKPLNSSTSKKNRKKNLRFTPGPRKNLNIEIFLSAFGY